LRNQIIMKYTDDLIRELITCEKHIVDSSGNLKEENGYLRRNLSLLSVDRDYEFFVFIRMNISFQENFSIGLEFNPREERGRVCLVRYNGPHGPNRQYPHHESCHIHRATEETISENRKPDSNIVETQLYSTFNDALNVFIRDINISVEDRKKHFPPIDTQGNLFSI